MGVWARKLSYFLKNGSYLAGVEHEKIAVDPSQVRINPNEILSLLGGSGGEVDSHTMQLIGNCISEARETMAPKAGYVRHQAVQSDTRAEIAIEGTRFQTGRIIGNNLYNADEFLFFMGTAGPGPEALSKLHLGNGNYLEGFIMDLVGSAIAESIARLVHEHIRTMTASQGIGATNRYSPGYCDWNVDEQKNLFGLFPHQFCGITLSASSLMIPIKSVSGVIGVGASARFNDYTCDNCSRKDCAYRHPHVFNHRD